MIRFIAPVFALLFIASCGEKVEEETVELNSTIDKISFALGADHALGFSNSGDPNFSLYKVPEMVKGFEMGLKDENAFDNNCQTLLQDVFSKAQNGKIDTAKINEVSLCIGKLSGVFFSSGWNRKKAMDKLDLKLVSTGFRFGLLGKDTILARSEQAKMIQDFIMDINKTNGITLLENAKKSPNSQVTASGLVLETIEEGKGGSPTKEDDVLAHYVLINAFGDTLQSSFEMVELYGQKLEPFSLAGVVAGWQEGIPMMKKGGKYKLYLPYNLAYGDEGMFNPQKNAYDIQPYEYLYFYIELLDYGKPGSLIKNK
jgi:FKBP-type peptidyl-prolyl cis-trans isomerase FkpA